TDLLLRLHPFPTRRSSDLAAQVRAVHADFEMPKLNQAEHAVWHLLRHRPAHLLPPGQADWNAFLADCAARVFQRLDGQPGGLARSEEHTSELQSRENLVCR